jgi:hypothetical protein
VSPILVRPVREQLEHDRIIRLLQVRFRRRYEVGMNPGAEQGAPVSGATGPIYPDLVLSSLERGRRLQAVVEVETGESVNHLEALAQWAHLGRLRAAFHLYVPASMVDVARRLCEESQVRVSEIWSYHNVGDQPRFTLVHRNRDEPPPPPERPARAPARRKATPAPKSVRAKGAKPAPKRPRASSKPRSKPKSKPRAAAARKRKGR